MKKFTLSVVMIGAWGIMHAQSLSPTVISSAGGFYENSAGKLSFTVGETMVQTFHNNNFLTQGFQQPFDYSVAVAEPSKEGVNFGVFPNPSSGYVYLVLNSKINAKVDIRLLDAVGKTVVRDHFTHSSGVNAYSYNWSNLASGMYMVEVVTTDLLTNVTTKSMKKINIIN
jgi:hypothetical protein